jgi:hypothetical protein
MHTDQLIPVKVFCESHRIEYSFISMLCDTGLIQVMVVDDISFVAPEQVEPLEKMVRLYYDLGINVEGIESITHLLERINSMQLEITALQNRLRLYED